MVCCGVQEAGYDESAQLMVEDVMMSKNVPDPRDVRKYDLIGVFGMVNYRTLRVRTCSKTQPHRKTPVVGWTPYHACCRLRSSAASRG